MRPAIQTERLNIFSINVRISNVCTIARRFYVGYHRRLDQPEHVVTATVREPVNGFPPHLDWIETNDRCRREGFARELLEAIEKDLGEAVIAHGGGEAGDAFCEAMAQRSEA